MGQKYPNNFYTQHCTKYCRAARLYSNLLVSLLLRRLIWSLFLVSQQSQYTSQIVRGYTYLQNENDKTLDLQSQCQDLSWRGCLPCGILSWAWQLENWSSASYESSRWTLSWIWWWIWVSSISLKLILVVSNLWICLKKSGKSSLSSSCWIQSQR